MDINNTLHSVGSELPDIFVSLDSALPITSSFSLLQSTEAEDDIPTVDFGATTSTSFASPITQLPPVEFSPPTEVPETAGTVDKKTQRRLRQNIATQEYRKRKKMHLESLEKTVSGLTEQLEEAQRELAQFKKQNFHDLVIPSSDFHATSKEGETIIKYIGDSLNQYRNQTPDQQKHSQHQLQHLLSLFWANMELIFTLLHPQVDKLANPFMQYTFSMFGFQLQNEHTPLLRLIPCAPWWGEFCKDAELTQDQISGIENLKNAALQSSSALFKERLQLAHSIHKMAHFIKVTGNIVAFDPPHISPYAPIYHHLHQSNLPQPPHPSQVPPLSGPELGPVRELKQKLDLMKSNFANSFSLVVSTHRQIGTMLTPYQHAQMVIKAYPPPPFIVSVEHFRKIWAMISSGAV